MPDAFLRRLPSDALLRGTSVALACAVGACGGVTLGFVLRAEADPPRVFSASGASVPTLVLEGFRDGALRGTAAGSFRLYALGEEVAVGPDGSFAIVRPGFRIEDVTVPVPPGMRFVASKKGKKYHAVDSASGERIAPENRVYFPDAASAERAGYAK